MGLWLSGSQCGGERAPIHIEPGDDALECAANIGWLLAIEIKVGFGRIGVAPSAVARQQPERNQRIKKIARPAGINAGTFAQGVTIEGFLGKDGENAKLDRAQ